MTLIYQKNMLSVEVLERVQWLTRYFRYKVAVFKHVHKTYDRLPAILSNCISKKRGPRPFTSDTALKKYCVPCFGTGEHQTS